MMHALVRPAFSLVGFCVARFGLGLGESGNFPAGDQDGRPSGSRSGSGPSPPASSTPAPTSAPSSRRSWSRFSSCPTGRTGSTPSSSPAPSAWHGSSSGWRPTRRRAHHPRISAAELDYIRSDSPPAELRSQDPAAQAPRGARDVGLRPGEDHRRRLVVLPLLGGQVPLRQVRPRYQGPRPSAHHHLRLRRLRAASPGGGSPRPSSAGLVRQPRPQDRPPRERALHPARRARHADPHPVQRRRRLLRAAADGPFHGGARGKRRRTGRALERVAGAGARGRRPGRAARPRGPELRLGQGVHGGGGGGHRRPPPSATWRPPLIGVRPQRPVYWIAVLLMACAAAGHQAWSANLFTVVSDVFPKAATASLVGFGGMFGAVAGLMADWSLGRVLSSSGPAGYLFAFLIAGSLYLVLLRGAAGPHAPDDARSTRTLDTRNPGNRHES